MDEYKRVKEQIWFIEQEVRIGNLSEHEATEQILSLVEIKSDDQKPPEFLTLTGISRLELVNKTRESMLKPDSEGKHFIRVIPKPKEGEV